ncbi:MAG: hypothetical protein JO069_06930 [Verrucomicrobia bacterium]|nr:hypothetical protein [Verrucomicrobiota bacterium]
MGGVPSTADTGQKQVTPAIQQSTWGTVEVLASRDVGKAKRVASNFGIARVVDSYEARLHDPDVGAVYLASR